MFMYIYVQDIVLVGMIRGHHWWMRQTVITSLRLEVCIADSMGTYVMWTVLIAGNVIIAQECVTASMGIRILIVQRLYKLVGIINIPWVGGMG